MATRKNTSAAVASMVATATAKAAATVAKAEATAAERISADTLARIHEAAEVQRAGEKKADGLRATAFNMAIDAARAAGLDAGEMKDLLADIIDKAVAAGDLTESTGKAYRNGLAFAVERHVPWTSTLHGTEAKVEALQAAGKAIPKALQAAAEKLAEKQAAAREAKNSKTHVASLDTVVKALAKALADSRTIGRGELAADILDVIHSIKPDFTEPKE
jgi:Skp family chaperone for outer membrane proteins